MVGCRSAAPISMVGRFSATSTSRQFRRSGTRNRTGSPGASTSRAGAPISAVRATCRAKTRRSGLRNWRKFRLRASGSGLSGWRPPKSNLEPHPRIHGRPARVRVLSGVYFVKSNPMKNLLRCAFVAALAFGIPLSATAQGQNLQLTMQDGRVTIIATDVPLRQILQEWSRIGQTKIINSEKLAGPPVTLQLVNKSEREALDIL